MSTIVQMPVRVKPPPAETGDTISPGCASLVIAMPLNGARMIVLSRSSARSSTCRSATLTCSRERGDARVDRIDFRLGRVELRLRDDAVFEQRGHAAERDLRFGEPDFVLLHVAAAPPRPAPWPAPARRAASSRPAARAPGPRVTAMPSSTLTSITLPVIFEEMVARRRAVTYPDAFSTAACDAGGALGHRRDLDLDRPLARRPHPRAAADASDDQQHQHPGDPPSGRGARARARCAERQGLILRSGMTRYSNPDESTRTQGGDNRSMTVKTR